jgi:hypothetical protein
MTPQTGQHVKVILRNGAIAEGIVEEWLANTVQLKSLDGESILIITHPTEDIMLIKVMLDKPEEVEVEPESTQEEVRDFDSQFQEAAKTTDPNDVDAVKSLAQLRIELNKQERRIIAEKLKDHRPSKGAYQPSTTPYHYPSVVTKTPTPYQPGRIPPNGRNIKKPSTK